MSEDYIHFRVLDEFEFRIDEIYDQLLFLEKRVMDLEAILNDILKELEKR